MNCLRIALLPITTVVIAFGGLSCSSPHDSQSEGLRYIDLEYADPPQCLTDGKTLVPATLSHDEIFRIKGVVEEVDHSPIVTISVAKDIDLQMITKSSEPNDARRKIDQMIVASTCGCIGSIAQTCGCGYHYLLQREHGTWRILGSSYWVS